MSAFPTPRVFQCEELRKEAYAGILQFTKTENNIQYKYFVHPPSPTPRFLVELDKENPLLTIEEVRGAPNEVFTWLLFDLGDESTMEIVCKRAITISEIQSKHGDIAKEL